MWPEIESTKSGNKRELNLHGAAVSERIDKSGLDATVFDLVNLNLLNISDTSLKELPPQISNLTNLQTILLFGNQLSELPKSIGKLDKLKLLDVSRNKLASLPQEMSDLINLTTINLSNNELESFPTQLKLTKLGQLDLSYNKLADFPDICNEQFTNLSELKLQNNEIIEIPHHIQFLINLKHFNMSVNRVTALPKALASISKLKDLHLDGNPISDKRLLKLIEQCRTKQVIDYVKLHGIDSPKDDSKSSKSRPSKKTAAKTVVKSVHKMIVSRHVEDSVRVIYMENVKDVRPFILCCSVRNLNLQNSNLKKFLQIQSKIHDTVCEKREKATIATHDLNKIKGGFIKYTANDPHLIEIIPLGKMKKVTAQKYYENLKAEADALRKEKKRNVFSGIHKYLYMLDKKETFACLEDGEGSVISLPPLTNGDLTKISPETTNVLIEVTSGTSIGDCRQIIEILLKEMLLAGFGTMENVDSSEEVTILNVLNIQQIKITDLDGNLRTVYPSKTDLHFDEPSNISVDRDEVKDVYLPHMPRYLHLEERISSIYDGEYFRVIQRKGDSLIVQCITCGPDAPQLRASRRSNGNILKHIQRRHSELLPKIRIEKNIKCRAPGIRRSTIKTDASNKISTTKKVNHSPTTISEDESKQKMVYIEASTPDSIEHFQYMDRADCSNEGDIQLLQTDDNLISEEQEASDFISHDNLNETSRDDHPTTSKHLDIKSDEIECVEYDECQETTCSDDINTKCSSSKELMQLKKELMLREFDEVQEMRREKHRFEIEILRRELEFKKIEHRKKMELLEKQLREK
ncbi:Leucine-rich repeat-containing protein 47 [Pseudolycoriella hygida]|uniref:Leucine-rich repeat-containing protein 47 n=1 Tax=Pseudolycoriella hygida TaxID=35572 RepID=A0A9Q0RVZ2_9DIPT|nr:Leucine-rich repeat-containing protein 47 [Pseudolycoriella hygida]